jgi:hypothetical protein
MSLLPNPLPRRYERGSAASATAGGAENAYTHFERLILLLLRLPRWQQAGILLLLLAFPFALAALEGLRGVPISGGWRGTVFPVVGIAYCILVAPWIWQAEKKVVEGLRPLAAGNFEAYDRLCRSVRWRTSTADWVAFAVGILVGAGVAVDWSSARYWHWADRYLFFSYLVMYGFLGWDIYAASSSARLTALLHRHIHHEDPFDLTCFEPVGRQALTLSLIFVGGTTLSVPFAHLEQFFLHWQYWVIYSILLAATIVPFFLVMWPTHRTLQRVKIEQLTAIEGLVGQSSAKLQTLAASGADTLSTATELQTWLALENRLHSTRTWPYDTNTLRTLFLSVLAPLFVGLGRVIGTLLTEQPFGW